MLQKSEKLSNQETVRAILSLISKFGLSGEDGLKLKISEIETQLSKIDLSRYSTTSEMLEAISREVGGITKFELTKPEGGFLPENGEK